MYLETRSVVATGVIGGSFGLASAGLGPWFGTYVDHHRKHAAMSVATTVSTACFAVAALVYVLVDTGSLLQLDRPWFWLLAMSTLAGSVAGMARSVALSTCVTMLCRPTVATRRTAWSAPSPASASPSPRSSAGSPSGGRMGWSLIITLVVTTVALVHLRTIRFTEPADPAEEGPRGSTRAAVEAIRGVPGLCS